MPNQGKISSLPAAIREEVCQRLHDGQTSSQILPWLNTQERVLRVLEERFAEQPVSPQNLSEYKNSKAGYQLWLNRKERLATTKSLARFSADLAESGKNLIDGSSAILGGQLLEILETVDVEDQKALLKEKPGTLIDLMEALSKMQASSTAARKLSHTERQLQIAEDKLELEIKKFQRQTAEAFLKYCEDEEAKRIASSKTSKTVKLDRLVDHIFGKNPNKKEVA